jgi:hypothetical protein
MGRIDLVAGRSILKPLRVIKITKKIPKLDDEANKDKKPGDVLETKNVKEKVIANFQLAEVIFTSNVPKVFTIGDVVVFRPGREIELDLIKKTVVVNDFDILGKWINE